MRGLSYRNYFVVGYRHSWHWAGACSVVWVQSTVARGAGNNYLWIFWPTLAAAAWIIFLSHYIFTTYWVKPSQRLARLTARPTWGTALVPDYFLRHGWGSLLSLSNPIGSAGLNVLTLPLVLLLATITYYCVKPPFLLRQCKYMQTVEFCAQGLKYQPTDLLMLECFLCIIRPQYLWDNVL